MAKFLADVKLPICDFLRLIGWQKDYGVYMLDDKLPIERMLVGLNSDDQNVTCLLETSSPHHQWFCLENAVESRYDLSYVGDKEFTDYKASHFKENYFELQKTAVTFHYEHPKDTVTYDKPVKLFTLYKMMTVVRTRVQLIRPDIRFTQYSSRAVVADAPNTAGYMTKLPQYIQLDSTDQFVIGTCSVVEGDEISALWCMIPYVVEPSYVPMPRSLSLRTSVVDEYGNAMSNYLTERNKNFVSSLFVFTRKNCTLTSRSDLKVEVCVFETDQFLIYNLQFIHRLNVSSHIDLTSFFIEFFELPLTADDIVVFSGKDRYGKFASFLQSSARVCFMTLPSE